MPLESSRLSSRLRELLRNSPGPAATDDEVRPLDAPVEGLRELRYVPDDEVTIAADAPTGCVVMERHYDLLAQHGRQTVGYYAEVVERGLPALAVLATDASAAAVAATERPTSFDFDRRRRLDDERRRSPVPSSGPLLFFDLETTGLSGGAGTVAFLVGCGYFDGAGFHARQYFLAGYEAEHELLVSLAAFAAQFGGLVTFNGRTFDVPLIDTRYLFHRLESPFSAMPHFDMLHPARKLWRRRRAGAAPDGEWPDLAMADGTSCALGALEEAILGVRRVDDVPGSEIPSRYFRYLRSGNLEPLNAVFEHNRLDLVSLAALMGVAMRMVDDGPEEIATPHEALALGQIYDALGRSAQAEACFARAAGLGDVPWRAETVERDIRANALRRLAIRQRREGRYGEAAGAWAGVLDAGGDERITQEARRALAIHHEHRARDLEAARQYAQRALACERNPAQADALRHRLARLERKLDQTKNRWAEGG